MTPDQTLRIRFHVLERVVGALIATHPDKAALVASLKRAELVAEALHLNETLMDDEAVELARACAAEWTDLAQHLLHPPAPRG